MGNLAFRKDLKNLIFSRHRHSLYYNSTLHWYFTAYEDNLQQGRTLIDCPVSLTAPPHADTAACRVDIDKVIGSSDCRKEKDYGYEDGEPCILLKMNRVCAGAYLVGQ